MDAHAAPLLVPFHTAAARFAAGTQTPRAYLEDCIERIEALEGRVGAFVSLDVDAARQAADVSSERWRDGRPLSPIDGMPVGVKDIIATADLPTESGSPLFAGHRPLFDAASVAGLRDAGAVVVGKTVTTEFAATEPRGTRNPWDLTRTPGGSSSGSAAAVGCGMLPVGLGTQVVGSIIRPSGFCGVVGFKPSLGALNRGGSLDFLSQSCTGVLAASLEDAWIAAMAIALRVGGDPGYVPLAGPVSLPPARRPARLALLETPGWGVATDAAKEELRRAVTALRAAGVAVLTRADCPELAALEEALTEAGEVTTDINAWEWRWPLNSFMARDPHALSETIRKRHVYALGMNAAQYEAQLRRREAIRACHAALHKVADAALTLSAPGAAPVGLNWTGNPVFAVPASCLGAPAVTQPLLRDEGLPLGLQLMGYRGHDADLFAIAHAVRGIVAARF